MFGDAEGVVDYAGYFEEANWPECRPKGGEDCAFDDFGFDVAPSVRFEDCLEGGTKVEKGVHFLDGSYQHCDIDY